MHKSPTPSLRNPLGWIVAIGLLLLVPTSAGAWHVDEEKLREEGLDLEVEDLELELDDGVLEVDYRVDTTDWQRAARSGVSLWLGVFVERGRENSGQWDLWYAIPMVTDDGSAHFPEYLELRDRAHAAVRFIGISNGNYLSPGHGVFADQSLYVAIRGNHDDDHSHDDSDDPQIERHVQLEHRGSVLYTVETHLSYTGSLHRYAWFSPAFGFYQLHFWLQRQHLMTPHFRNHLNRRHHHRGSHHHHRRSHPRRRIHR